MKALLLVLVFSLTGCVTVQQCGEPEPLDEMPLSVGF